MGPSSKEEQFNVSAQIAADVNATSLAEMRKVDAWTLVNSTHYVRAKFTVTSSNCVLQSRLRA